MEIAFVPDWVLRHFSKEKSVQRHMNVLLSCSVAALALLLFNSGQISTIVPHFCLVQFLFRVPCPGCGITRSLSAFFRLDLRDAWSNNPVGPFLGAFLWSQIPGRVLAIRSKHFECGFIEFSSIAGRILVLALVAVWLCRLF